MTNYNQSIPAGYILRPQQEFILSELAKAKDSGKKFCVLNAATGQGKSIIALTLANSVNKPNDGFINFVKSGEIFELEDEEVSSSMRQGCAILTVTKALQDQYFNDFPEGKILKGKSNYACAQALDLTCDIGPCVFDKAFKAMCAQGEGCPHTNAKIESVIAQYSFYNYAMFFNLPPACRAKKILVCDEAAELEDLLVKYFTVEFKTDYFKKLGIAYPRTPDQGSQYERYVSWLRTTKDIVYSALQECKSDLKHAKNKTKSAQRYRAISILNDSCDRILEEISDSEFIIEHQKDGLVFKPYKVDKLAQKFFKHCDFVVLMSATIIDHKNFAKQLGISPAEYHYIESESTFDPKKAPIYLSSKVSVTYKNKSETIPILADITEQIVKSSKNKKGIVHTHSTDILNVLKDKYGYNRRYLFRDSGATNEFLMTEHLERNDGTVLVSPSLTHGISLDGDLGEFAIIMKAPFLPLNDLRVKRLCEEDTDWYIDKMISTFIQMCGRTIRSETDTSITYVLDGTLTKNLLRYKERLPKYIIQRFQ